MYGIFNSIQEIDYSVLPKKFIIKTTDGGGGLNVLICKNKSKITTDIVLKKFPFTQKPSINIAREWAYQNLKRRIIIEELLEDPNNPNGVVNDFKFFCFSGCVKYIVVDYGRFSRHKRNFYDREWNLLTVSSDHENIDKVILKPKNLNEMIKIAEKTSSPFPALRVDLYNISGLIRFGEMTFYPWSGYIKFIPDEFDFELGKNFDIKYENYY